MTGCRRQTAAASGLATTFAQSARSWDDFNPDLVLVWGDDQYENFQEDIVPAFCLLGYDPDVEIKPWQTNGHGGNGAMAASRTAGTSRGIWGLQLHGHRRGGGNSSPPD